MLVFDRSGSMGFGGQDPPQPLTDAKNAALVFIDGMQDVDQVGLVSFATVASDPVDQTLTSLQSSVKKAIESIVIFSPASEQHTNIGDGIEKATQELLSMRNNSRAKKAIVLLTDGVASRPLNPEKETDQDYPEAYASERAEIARNSEISLYTIGLGDAVNEEFLRDNIATAPNYYYKAATSAGLKEIYDEIAQAVCEEESFTTDVVVHVKPAQNTDVGF
jgi:Mg-chelatase subunit ChlD